MKIALIGATAEEVQPFLDFFDGSKNVKIAGNNFHIFHYNKHEIIVCYSRIGKVFATLATTILIEHFHCDTVLFSGVGGGIDDEFSIGDLVYAESLVQHDVDITAFGYKSGYIPGEDIYIKSDKNLNILAQKVSKDNYISIKEGMIATGDQFIHSIQHKNWIKKTFSADVLEMEGAAIAVVCSAYKIPFFILRSISDNADRNAENDFDMSLVASSKKAANFIIKMIDSM